MRVRFVLEVDGRRSTARIDLAEIAADAAKVLAGHGHTVETFAVFEEGSPRSLIVAFRSGYAIADGHYWRSRRGRVEAAPVSRSGELPAEDEWYLPEPRLLDPEVAERTAEIMAAVAELEGTALVDDVTASLERTLAELDDLDELLAVVNGREEATHG